MDTSSTKPQELQVEAYKILVSMLQNDDNLFWRRSDVLIAINGGMLIVLGLMRSFETAGATESLKAFSFAICVIGVSVCILWYLIAKRSEAFYDHWHEQLKLLEDEHLAPVHIFSLADQFFAKHCVQLGNASFKLGRLAGLLRMTTAMQILAAIFSVVWFCLGLYLLIRT
jgi:hypothetical protein